MKNKVRAMLRTRILSIVCIVVFCFFLLVTIGLAVFMNTGDYRGKNKDFAKISTIGNVETKSFDFEEFERLFFFSETYRNEKCIFTDQIPTLKIVNSDEYRVEVTTNSELLDLLDLQAAEKALYFTFLPENFNNIQKSNKAYKGLYVSCDTFEVTVYAPVCELRSHTEFNLDYQAPEAKSILLMVDGEIRNGKIYDVKSSYFGINACGNSNITVSGEATSTIELVAHHNSKIDVTDLNGPIAYMAAYCQFFGSSYIKHPGGTFFPYTNIGFLLTVFVIFILVVSLVGFVVFLILFFKLKAEVDLLIAEYERNPNEEKIEKK